MTPRRSIRTLALLLSLVMLAFPLTACGSGNEDLAWEAPQFPRRSDLGDLAPAEGQNQRLFNDATMTLDTPDGAQYTIDAELLWVVLYSPDRSTDRALDSFEFRHPIGRDDADIIPTLSELAASVGYQFDEQAATDFVTSNDDGFSMTVKPLTEDEYGIYLEVQEGLNNLVMATVTFPIEGGPISDVPDDFEPHPFNGRPIDS